jgi:antitoxin (DNA-binding transcriptional repressor) of toxin-antitoxin stability system
MKIAPMADVRNNFAKYLEACADEPVFVTKNGRVTAVLEFMADDDIEDFLLERSARFRGMLKRVKREKGGISLAAYRKSRRI